MKTRTLVVLVALLAAGCGGASVLAPAASYAQYETPSADFDAIQGQAFSGHGMQADFEAEYSFADEEPAGASGAPQPAERPEPTKKAVSGTSYGKTEPGTGPGAGKAEARKERPEPEEPMVVYLGYLKLRVKRLLESVDRIVQIVEEKKGYIESLAARVVVVRIPASDFEAVMGAFADVGEVLDRRVKALDVTAQFTDLGARLAVAREARDRLLKLLAETRDVEERLRILEEIKRLSEQIESIESTLDTLQNLVDYFTIVIDLEPVLEGSAAEIHRSPFAWIRSLEAHLPTVVEGRDEIDITLPKGFVLFDKDDIFRAQAADTTTLRAGRVDNEPRGDNAFWATAVDHEMIGRDEEKVAEGTAGALAYRVFRSKDVKPRYYLVAVHARGDDLYVVEAFFPNEESYQTHGEAVMAALATFRAR